MSHLRALAALAAACTAQARNFGMVHEFNVHIMKADGSEETTHTVAVVALGWADAWMLMGCAMQEFMQSENARVVLDVQALRPHDRKDRAERMRDLREWVEQYATEDLPEQFKDLLR